MTDIAGRNILVTGGASGIGRRMALELARGGGRPVLWDLDAGRLEAVRGEIEAVAGEAAPGFVCDVSRREQVAERARETEATVGPVDVVIQNAGVVSGHDFLDLPEEKIEATFAVNTLALFWVAKAFLPGMVARRRGHLVTIASASSMIGVARLSDYAASKWAAMGFDESLRAELARTAPGVRTTVACPYYIDTGMFRGVRSRFPRLLPILDEEEVARAVVRAVQRDRARVCLPRLVHWLPLLRVLPVPVFDAIARWLGVNASMDAFVGRAPGALPRTPQEGRS